MSRGRFDTPRTRGATCSAEPDEKTPGRNVGGFFVFA